jgi:hypothetical protein
MVEEEMGGSANLLSEQVSQEGATPRQRLSLFVMVYHKQREE